MDLVHLAYFREAAMREHITQAAKTLHITQPTLSKVISQLERELGCELFLRDGKNVRLSQSGRVLLRYANKFSELIDDLHKELSDVKEGFVGAINVGSRFSTQEPTKIWEVTATFMRNNPDIRLGVALLPPPVLKDSLLNGNIDVALTTAPLICSGTKWIGLYEDRLGVVLSGHNPLASQESVSLGQLSEVCFLCRDMDSDDDHLIRQFCGMAGFEPEIQYTACVPERFDEMLCQNRGVTLISPFSLEQHQNELWKESGIVFRPIQESYCKRWYGIGVRSDVYLPAALRSYLETLCAAFGRNPEEI